MNYFLLDGVIRSSNVVEKAEGVAEAVDASTTVATAGGGFLSTPIGMIIYIAFIFGLVYFLWIRPQKKREKELAKMQDEIKLGDWVLLDSGMYGKVAGISSTVYTIEFGTNKGVLIPVLKQRIVAKGEPNFNDVEQK